LIENDPQRAFFIIQLLAIVADEGFRGTNLVDSAPALTGVSLKRPNSYQLLPQPLGFSKAKKAALLLFSVALLLAGGAAAVRAQSALDGFDPNANDTISVVVVQPDGKILIGGSFTSLLPNGGTRVTRNHIARLNPDGTLDTAFNPDANGFVNAIAVQADGKILVGGQFSNIGGETRIALARLKNDTIVLQNLAVTQTTITWTHGESVLIVSNSTTQIRGGASPQFTRVTFESSEAT
jgi:uncharacterized delta-60 repeat protein